MHLAPPGKHLKIFLGPVPEFPESVGLDQGSRICMSHKFPGGNNAGLGNHTLRQQNERNPGQRTGFFPQTVWLISCRGRKPSHFPSRFFNWSNNLTDIKSADRRKI